MANAWAVVLADPNVAEDADSVEAVSRVVAKALRVAPYDATRMVRDASGILGDDLSAREAEGLAGALLAEGFAAAAVDASIVPVQDDPLRVRSIRSDPEGLHLMIGYFGEETIPWTGVQMVSVCRTVEQQVRMKVEKKRSRKGAFGGMAAFAVGGMVGYAVHQAVSAAKNSAGRNMTAAVSEGECFVADIHLLDPVRVARVRSSGCQFPGLADRVRERAEWNFQTVLADMALHGEVPMTPPAERFLAGDPLEDSTMENLHIFERYNRWLLLASMAFAGPDDGEGGDAGSIRVDESAEAPPQDGAGRTRRDDFAF
jgi:hypothetical protein